MLCLNINLHKHPNIYLSILFGVSFFISALLYIFLFTALWFIVTALCTCSMVLFGLITTTRLNKYYYYRY